MTTRSYIRFIRAACRFGPRIAMRCSQRTFAGQVAGPPERIVQRLRTLEDEHWQRSARHLDYPTYNVRIMFRHAVLHDMLHCYRIEELLLKKDWT